MTENNEVNIPLLRKAVEWVEAEAKRPATERQWYQKNWVTPESRKILDDQSALVNHCGTAYCVAGYVGQLVDPAFINSDWTADRDVHVSDVAMEALGLTSGQAGRLFHANNTAEDVRRIAEEIAGERL